MFPFTNRKGTNPYASNEAWDAHYDTQKAASDNAARESTLNQAWDSAKTEKANKATRALRNMRGHI